MADDHGWFCGQLPGDDLVDYTPDRCIVYIDKHISKQLPDAVVRHARDPSIDDTDDGLHPFPVLRTAGSGARAEFVLHLPVSDLVIIASLNCHFFQESSITVIGS